jgi:hypothetical protein
LGIAAEQRGQKFIHAAGLAGTGIAGEEEVAVGLVARHEKPANFNTIWPAIRNDSALRVADETAMIGEKKQGAGAGAGCRRVLPLQTSMAYRAAGHPPGRRKPRRPPAKGGGRAQSRIVPSQTAPEESKRDTEENGHDSKGHNRDRVRLLEPLAKHYIGGGRPLFTCRAATNEREPRAGRAARPTEIRVGEKCRSWVAFGQVPELEHYP